MIISRFLVVIFSLIMTNDLTGFFVLMFTVAYIMGHFDNKNVDWDFLSSLKETIKEINKSNKGG